MRTTTNRTNWPINGGAVAFQPGWFANHPTAYIYINMGFGNEPLNMSHPLIPHFQLVGPSAEPYEGTFCMPQLPLPANITAKVGDNATIQVIETALHGAALYAVSLAACVCVSQEETSNSPQVRGHHLCRTGRRSRSELDQLLQLDRSRAQPHLCVVKSIGCHHGDTRARCGACGGAYASVGGADVAFVVGASRKEEDLLLLSF